ncbi:beta-lactamase [Blastomyces silverae]|uniref:Beta-lactamase n=1 Tax=Blastomyces silverae TaxID=2060906 RepID=A0A0H1BHP7_9EURO|nr:beta-lactamase [Blastomyces silverae]
METFNRVARSLTADGPDRVLPGVALIAANKNGDTLYSDSFGFTDKGPFTVDTPIWFASCTKLVTSIAVLQCVEKGLIDLDENVGRILPELADPDVLHGFDEGTGEPVIKKAEKKITYRHLLSHTSGLGYDSWHPPLVKWTEATKTKPVTARAPVEKLVYPLLSEPGEGWIYGAGLDWAGKAVERLHGGIKLEKYFRAHIFEPLGMQHTTLRPSHSSHIIATKAESTARGPTGELIPAPVETQPIFKPADEYGGHGLWSTAEEYIKLLTSILKDDGKLLSSATLSTLFEPQLHDNSHLIQYMRSTGSEMAMANGVLGNGTWNHSLGGVLATEDIPNRRLKGAINWHGLDNTYWWIDRERGTCGLSATQLAGYFDAEAVSLFSKFEAMIFQRSGA